MTLYKFTAHTRPTRESTQNFTRVIDVAAYGTTLADAEARAVELLGPAPDNRVWELAVRIIEDSPRPLPDREKIAEVIARSLRQDIDPDAPARVYELHHLAADAVLELFR